MLQNLPTLHLVSNLILATGFLLPSSLCNDKGLILRGCVIIGLFLGNVITPEPCEMSCSHTWTYVLVLVNFLRMAKTIYDGRVSLTPSHLRTAYSALAEPFGVHRREFQMLTKGSKLVGIGAGETLFREGAPLCPESGSKISLMGSRTSCVSRTGNGTNSFPLLLLLTGQMTASHRGIQLHSVKPNEFVNSIEWKYVQKRFNYEKHQVSVHVTEDSTYLKLDASSLDNIKISAHKDHMMLWRYFRIILGRDISRKLYATSVSLEVSHRRLFHSAMARDPMIRSLSLDALHTSNSNAVVTQNWLEARRTRWKQRRRKCASMNSLVESNLLSNMQKHSDVSYLVQKSWKPLAKKIQRKDYARGVLPSLYVQENLLNKCPDKDVVRREFEWTRDFSHCGVCQFCRPWDDAGQGADAQSPTHPSLNI